MRKIIGNIEGNYIEIETKISFFEKKKYQNTNRTLVTINKKGDNIFRPIKPEEDADVILLSSKIIKMSEGGKIIENPGLGQLLSSVDNLENIEKAIEIIKKENKLGQYSYDKSSAGIDELKEEIEKLYEEIEEIEKIIFEKEGNLMLK